jgi:hypothetical protein
MINHVGMNALNAGSTTPSRAAPYTSPVARGGIGRFMFVPMPSPAPVSLNRPEPGYNGCWWNET